MADQQQALLHSFWSASIGLSVCHITVPDDCLYDMNGDLGDAFLCETWCSHSDAASLKFY